MVLDECYLDRFDSHQGVHNATIKNSTLGFGILVIGGGDLNIENVYRVSGKAFIHLRMDYNSVFDGDVTLKNCRFGSTLTTAIEGLWIRFFNGLVNHVTNSLSIDGIVADSGELTLYDIRSASVDALTDEINALYLPKSVTIKSVCDSEGNPIDVRIATAEKIFDGVEVIK